MGMLLSIHRAKRMQSSCERPARHPVSNTIGNLAPIARIRSKSSRPFSPGISKSRIARLNAPSRNRVSESVLSMLVPIIKFVTDQEQSASTQQRLCLSNGLMDSAQVAANKMPVDVSPVRIHKQCILCVDDDVLGTTMRAEILKDHGFSVVVFHSPLEVTRCDLSAWIRFVRHSCCRSLAVNQVLDRCFGCSVSGDARRE